MKIGIISLYRRIPFFNPLTAGDDPRSFHHTYTTMTASLYLQFSQEGGRWLR